MSFLLPLDDRIYVLLNSLVGRSALFDTLVALFADNVLVKAAPVCAALFYAWCSGDAEAKRRRRVVLLATLLAAVLATATSKFVGGEDFNPRPFVRSVPIYFLEGDKLVRSPVLPLRVPAVGEMPARVQSLEQQATNPNNLDSFPSDHAAIFFALALGIALACRSAGIFALIWTGLVLVSRIVTGMHSALDVVVGLALGGAITAVVVAIALRWARPLFGRIADWTMRHEAMAAGLLFMALFEMTDLFENVRGIVQMYRGHALGIVAAFGLAGCGFQHHGGMTVEDGWKPEVIASEKSGVTSPDGLRWVGDKLLIADEGGSAIRTWQPGRGFTTIADARDGIKTPEDLVADAAGNVYFTDDKAGGVRRTDKTGHTILFAGPAQGIGVTEGIALAPSGRLLVSDPDHHRIASIGMNGDVQTFIPPSSPVVRAESLAFTPDGDLYISDNVGKKIYLLTRDGKFHQPIPPEPGFIPEGIYYSARYGLLITDKLDGALFRYTPLDGLRRIAMLGGQLADIQGLTEDPAGNIYVTIQTNLHKKRGLLVRLTRLR